MSFGPCPATSASSTYGIGLAGRREAADNPFIDVPGASPEIWALGLCNPWGLYAYAATDELWIVDAGVNGVGEINVAQGGG